MPVSINVLKKPVANWNPNKKPVYPTVLDDTSTQMNSLPIDLQDEQTFLLIRLPKATVERTQSGGKAGSVFVYDDGRSEFQDAESLKLYSLFKNEIPKVKQQTSSQETQCRTATNIENNVVSSEESDLISISLDKDEALHLGTVKSSVLFAVPKVDEKDV